MPSYPWDVAQGGPPTRSRNSAPRPSQSPCAVHTRQQLVAIAASAAAVSLTQIADGAEEETKRPRPRTRQRADAARTGVPAETDPGFAKISHGQRKLRKLRYFRFDFDRKIHPGNLWPTSVAPSLASSQDKGEEGKERGGGRTTGAFQTPIQVRELIGVLTH